MPHRLPPRPTALIAAFLLPLPLVSTAQADETPSTLHALTYSASQQPLADLDREISLAGLDPAKLAALEQRLLRALARRDATFAGRQAIAERLALVLSSSAEPASPSTYKTLAGMLADPRDSDLARLALQPVPGAAIDELFLSALPDASGNARLGILDTLAFRRPAAAVPALARLLADSDTDANTARAAARALGAIGSSAALAALHTAPIELTAAARLAAATHLPTTEALNELRSLENDAGAPATIRHAAFRTTLDLDPAGAADRIAAALAAPDRARRQVALEAIAPSRAPNLAATLLPQLGTFDVPTQAAVLTALGRSHARATLDPSPFLEYARNAAAGPRQAAIVALGFLPGRPAVVTALAHIAANTDATEDARLARQSLARLDGPGVSAAIVAGAESAEASLRPAYIEQLALRNLTEALPLLRRMRSDSDRAVRLAALAALGDIAPPSDERTLLDWTLAATDEAEQSRALRSLVSVTLRDPSPDRRGQLLFDALQTAPSDVALRLLPALARIGGERSAAAAARLATRDDPAVSSAVTEALTRWSDATALPALATVAEKGSSSSVRDTARAGALRYFQRHREPWSPAMSDAVASLLRTTDKPDERRDLIALLHRANDSAALDLAQSFANDPELGPAAKTAADVIRANLAGPPALRASGATANLKNILDHKPATRWSVPTLGEEWLEIDFHLARPLSSLVLDHATRAAEFPERYEVHVTDDPANPGPIVTSGRGQRGKTTITFPPNTRGRYAILRNVAERKDSQWSIAELHVD